MAPYSMDNCVSFPAKDSYRFFMRGSFIWRNLARFWAMLVAYWTNFMSQANRLSRQIDESSWWDFKSSLRCKRVRLKALKSVSYLGSSRAIKPSRKSRRRDGEEEINLSSLGSNKTTGKRFFLVKAFDLLSFMMNSLLIFPEIESSLMRRSPKSPSR